jgi:RNA polymerase sigma factor (sigma-70 family)
LDNKEYNTVVKTHSNNLYRFILKMLKDKDGTNDIVQDAFMKLWQHIEQVDFDKAKSWLFTTARNTMLNKIKRDKRTESMDSGNFSEPYANNNNFELKELIDKSLDQLPELQKSIILLRDLEGYDYKEIGEILDLNESQVKVYLFRGRQKIKEALKNTITYHENN